MSDVELGLEALRGAGSLRQAEDIFHAADRQASVRVLRGKPKTSGALGSTPSSSSKGRAAPVPPPARAPPSAPFSLPPEVTAAREQWDSATADLLLGSGIQSA